MKKHAFTVLSLILFILCTVSVHSLDKEVEKANKDFYCMEYFDKYREIKYWSSRRVMVGDYDYDTGDAEYLKLCSKDPNMPLLTIPCKEIVEYFNAEFNRLFDKKNIPFHDAYANSIKQYAEMKEKHGHKENFDELWQASEEARKSALYGTNPAQISCLIEISRREFPVLYEMTTYLRSEKSSPIDQAYMPTVRKLGFSSPEYIIDELKRSITQQLEELSSKLKLINECA